MKLVFEKLPESLEEMRALPYAKLDRPEYAIGLFLCAMDLYPRSREAALDMVRYLYGPAGLSPMAQQFLRDRMMDNDYVPRSFFDGASPDNDYTPSLPYTLDIFENPYSYQNEGYAKLFLRSSGADSPRYAVTRLKKSTGEWFLSDQLLLAGIRVPKSSDPWA